MKYPKKIGVSLLIISLILLPLDFKISGNVISNYFSQSLSFMQITGFIFLFVSLIFLSYKESLDAIIIPTGSKEHGIERTEKAIDVYNKNKNKNLKLIISGDKSYPLNKSQRYGIYKMLREENIRPYDMKIRKAKNSIENILYALASENNKTIGIVSYPAHLWRFQYIFDKAKKQGKIPKNIKLIKIPTKEKFKDKIYGFLALVKEKYNLRKGFDKTKKTGRLGNYIKKFIS
jgi:hypothetical protein